MKHSPLFLLINPPIHDFAALDLWFKTLELLYIAVALEKARATIKLVYCLNSNHSLVSERKSNAYGCGKYFYEEVNKPHILKYIPRSYKRYGISSKMFINELEACRKLGLYFVTSGMIYWYSGVNEA